MSKNARYKVYLKPTKNTALEDCTSIQYFDTYEEAKALADHVQSGHFFGAEDTYIEEIIAPTSH